MPVSLVHLTTQAAISAGGTSTISIPAVAAGNALVVAIGSDFDTGGNPTLAGLTDSAGDTFTRAVFQPETSFVGTADIWYCLAPTAGTNSIVITPAGYSAGVWIYELNSGVAGVGLAVDDSELSGAASSAGSTTCEGPGVIGTAASDFSIAVCGTAQHVTAVSSPWSLDPLLASATAGTQASAHYVGTGSQKATFTQDAAGGFVIVSVAFRPTGATFSGYRPTAYVWDAGTTPSDNTLVTPALAYDPDTAPPTTYAEIQTIHFSGVAATGCYLVESFAVPDASILAAAVAIRIVIWSRNPSGQAYTFYRDAYWNDQNLGIFNLPWGSPPAGWNQIIYDTNTNDDPIEETFTIWTSGSGAQPDLTKLQLAFKELGTLFYQGPPSVVWDIFDCYIEVDTGVAGCQPSTLAQAMVNICERAGLTSGEVDVSLINNINVQPVPLLHGYLIDRPTTAAQALQEIMRAYFIDACETNGTIRFVPRGYAQSPPLIPELDLGLDEDKAELVEQQAQEEDLPISVTTLYTNQQYNYQQGKQIKQRNPRILTVATRNMRTLSLPFVFLAEEARQIAEADLYSSWDNRLSYKLNLWRASWVLLDPTDRVRLVYEGATYHVRLTSAHVGQNLTVALEAMLDDVRDYNSSAVGGTSQGSSPMTGGAGGGGAGTGGGGAATGPGAPGVGPPALTSTSLWLLDIPYLQDADATPGSSGFYAVMSSGAAAFAGATLFESSDGANFNPLKGVTHAADFGYPTTALAAPSSPWAWDTVNTLTIQMTVGTLSGTTDAQVLAGANGLIVGQEILQFVNATDNGGGSFTISRLLRGRRGTDGFCSSHATGEVAFAPLQGGVLHQKEPVSHIGALWYYRGVTSGATLDSASNVPLTLAGNDLKPYSVVNIGGALDGSNNWTITWTRRARAGGTYGTGAEALIDGLNGPLNEQVESYQVDVMSGSTVKRTITTSVATAVYTAAQQTADFGAVQSSLVVHIYQMSATVGRGFQATATLPASGAAAISVVSGDTYVN